MSPSPTFTKLHRAFFQLPARSFFTLTNLSMHFNPPTTKLLEEFRSLDCKEGSSIFTQRVTPSILLIRLNNPKRLNSLTGKMMAELHDTISQVELELKQTENTSELYGLIIEGVGGKSFCAGLDLDLVKDHFNTPEIGAQLSQFLQALFVRIKMLPLISVACIEGYAFGGGAELSTATDFRFVSLGSKVRFVHRDIGTVPGWGGASRLTELLGHTKALYHLASTKPLEIPQLGESNDYFFKSCESGTTTKEALAFLDSFVDKATDKNLAIYGVRKIKQLMEKVRLAESPHHSLDIERTSFNQLWGSTRNLESVRLAIEKKGKL